MRACRRTRPSSRTPASGRFQRRRAGIFTFRERHALPPVGRILSWNQKGADRSPAHVPTTDLEPVWVRHGEKSGPPQDGVLGCGLALWDAAGSASGAATRSAPMQGCWGAWSTRDGYTLPAWHPQRGSLSGLPVGAAEVWRTLTSMPMGDGRAMTFEGTCGWRWGCHKPRYGRPITLTS
jgi:hypothetical protein